MASWENEFLATKPEPETANTWESEFIQPVSEPPTSPTLQTQPDPRTIPFVDSDNRQHNIPTDGYESDEDAYTAWLNGENEPLSIVDAPEGAPEGATIAPDVPHETTLLDDLVPRKPIGSQLAQQIESMRAGRSQDKPKDFAEDIADQMARPADLDIGHGLSNLQQLKDMQKARPITPAVAEGVSRANATLDSGYDPNALQAMGHQIKSGMSYHGLSAGFYGALSDAAEGLSSAIESGKARLLPGVGSIDTKSMKKAASWLEDVAYDNAVAKVYNQVLSEKGMPGGIAGETLRSVAAIPDMGMMMLLAAMSPAGAASASNVGLGAMATQVAADTYGNSRYIEGKDEGAAAWDAFRQATYETVFDKLFGVLEPALGKLPIWKKVITAGLREAPSEITTEMFQMVDQALVNGEPMPGIVEQMLQLAKAGYGGIIVGGGIGAMGGTVRAGTNYLNKRADDKQFTGILSNLAKERATDSLKPDQAQLHRVADALDLRHDYFDNLVAKKQSPSDGRSEAFDAGFNEVNAMLDGEQGETFGQQQTGPSLGPNFEVVDGIRYQSNEPTTSPIARPEELQQPAQAEQQGETVSPEPIEDTSVIQGTVDFLQQQGIEAVDPLTLATDPETFQYKQGGDSEGVLDTLRSVKTWDNSKAGQIMVYEYADGRRVVADGHQRTGLARRLAQEGKQPNIRILARVLRETDGFTPKDARDLAATTNIAQGTGTAIDAAKIIRDNPDPQDQAKMLETMPVGQALVRDAIGLSKLGDTAFMNVVNDQVTAPIGALVGQRFSEPAQQEAAMQVLINNKPANADQARVMLEDVAAAGFTQSEQGGLFGDAMMESNIKQRAWILAGSVSRVRKDKALFGGLVRNKDKIGKTGDNKLDVDANQQVLTESQRIENTLIQSINTTPELNRILNDLSGQLKAGKITRAKAIQGFTEQARTYISNGGRLGERRPDDQGGVPATEAEKPESQAPEGLILTPEPTQAEQAAEKKRQQQEGQQDVPVGMGAGDLFAGPQPADMFPGTTLEGEKNPRPESGQKADTETTKGTETVPEQKAESDAESDAESTDDVLFSRAEKSPKNLYVAHNLSADNIRHVDELGGLAAPSLAVANIDTGSFTSFGEITLLADPSIIESPKARTFDADVYSPRHPQATYIFKDGSYRSLKKRIDALPGDFIFIDEDSLSRGGPRDLLHSDAMKLLFLTERGIEPKTKQVKVDAWVKRFANTDMNVWELQENPAFIAAITKQHKARLAALKEIAPGLAKRSEESTFDKADDGTLTLNSNTLHGAAQVVVRHRESGGVDQSALRRAIARKFRTKKMAQEYESWVTDEFNSMVADKKLFKGFTYSGRRKYTPYTLDNVVREMTRQLQGGENFNYGAGTVRSAYATEMKTVAQVKKQRDRVVSKERMAEIGKESQERLFDALDKLRPYYKFDANSFGYMDDASAAIAEGPKGWNEAFNMDADSRKIITDLIDYLKDLPTEYFETKIQRAVDLGEFEHAVLPRNTPKDVVKILKDSGLNLRYYKSGDAADRVRAIKSAPGVLFNRMDKSQVGEIQGDLFDPANLPKQPAAAKAQMADTFHTEYLQRQVDTLNVGFDVVNDAEDAAHIVAPIRKNAQEQFLVLVLDKNNKVISVIRHSIGQKTASSVDELTVLGAIASTPGAASVWLAHHHPTGDPEPSSADYAVTGRLIDGMDGMSIDYKGHVVIGQDGRFADIKAGQGYSMPGKVRPSPRTTTVPVFERQLKKRGRNLVKAKPNDPAFIDYLNSLQSDRGLVLLDTKLYAIGVISMTKDEMGKLRSNKRVERILSAIDATNAVEVLIFNKKGGADSGVANLNNYLAKFIKEYDQRGNIVHEGAIDIFTSEGGSLRSLRATHNEPPVQSGVFLSRKTGSERSKAKGQVTIGTKRLEAAIEDMTGEPIAEGTYTSVTPPTTYKPGIQAIQKVFGKRVVFIKVNGDAPINFNGATLPSKPNVIYVNIDSQNPFMGVTGHELLHTLRVQHPELYDRIVRLALEHIKSTGFDRFKSKLNELIDENTGDKRMSDDKVLEEMVADLVGEAFMDPAFVNRLAAQDRTFIERVVAAIMDILNAIQNRMQSRGMGSSKYFNDVEALKGRVQALLQEQVQSGQQPHSETAGAPAFQTVYHGSPHTWDLVDLSHVGTGEGAQAYGWGFYAAENKGVGVSYQKLGDDPNRLAGEILKEIGGVKAPMGVAIDAANRFKYNKGDVEATVGYLRENAEDFKKDGEPAHAEAYTNMADAMQKHLDKGGKFPEVTSGNLYELDLPDGVIEKMLDWDKPIRKQADAIKDAAAKALALDAGAAPDSPNFAGIVSTIRPQMDSTGMTGEQLYRKISSQQYISGKAPSRADGVLDPQESASKALNSMGIPGIKYRDGQSRTGRKTAKQFLNELPEDAGFEDVSAAMDSFTPEMQELVKALEADDWLGFDYPAQAIQAAFKDLGNYDASDRLKMAVEGSITRNFVVFDAKNLKTLTRNGEKITLPKLAEEVNFQRSRRPSRATRRNPNQIPIGSNPNFSNYTLPTRTLSDTMRDDSMGLVNRALKGTENLRMNARQWGQDSMIPLKRIQQAIEKSGGTIADYMNVYEREQQLSGRVEYNFKKMESEDLAPLISHMKAYGIDQKMLGDYLYARHARARNDRIAEINDKFPDGGSGMTNREADAILHKFGKDGMLQKLRKVATYVDRIQEKTRSNFNRYQLVIPEVLQSWTEPNDFNDTYVPLRGFEDVLNEEFGRTGMGFDIRGDEFKRALGRKSRASELLGNVLSAYKLSVIRGEKNRVGRALHDLVMAHPNDNLWKSSPVNIIQRFDKKTGKVIDVVDMNWNNPDVFYTKIQGKPYAIELRDPRLQVAMKDLGADVMGPFLGAIATTTRYLSMTRTMLSPEFVALNFVRDSQEAAVNLMAEADQTLLKKTMNRRAITSAMRAMYNKQRGTYKGDATWLRYADEYTEDGGRVAFFRPESVEQLARSVDSSIKRIGNNPGAIARRTGKAAIEFVEDMNLAVENAVRLAAYRAARESGISRQKSAILAKNLTVNFNRKGAGSQWFRAMYLFSNAAVQGAQRALMASKSPRVRKVLYSTALAGATFTIFNQLFGGDDDDGESLYDKIPDYLKTTRLILMIPDALKDYLPETIPGIRYADEERKRGMYVMMPLPYGYSVPYVLGTTVADSMFGQDAAESAVRVIDTISNSFNPFDSGTMATMLSPTLVDPFIEVWTNRNYFDGPVHPIENPWDDTPDPKSHSGWQNTAGAYKWFAKQMNDWSGGTDTHPGAIDYHPETYRHFLEFAAGGTGGFIERIMDNTSAALNPDRRMNVNRLPFIRTFIGSTNDYTDSQRFYDNIKEVGYTAKEDENYRQQVLDDEIPAYRYEQWKKDRKEIFEAGLIPAAKSAEERIKKLRTRLKKERLVDRNSETVKQIEKDILKIQIDFNKIYNDATLDRGWLRESLSWDDE